MPTSKQNTTDITLGTNYGVGTWGAGSSDTVVRNKSFPATATALPSYDVVWDEYFNNVLRGNSDGFSPDSPNADWVVSIDPEGAAFNVSRTYSDNGPTVLSEVVLDPGGAAGGNGAQGYPSSPYTPSLASPAAGGNLDAGLNWTEIPACVNPVDAGMGNNAWPQVQPSDAKMSPDEGSGQQATNGGLSAAEAAISPTYLLGTWNIADGAE